MSELPIFEHFLSVGSVGNFKPKLKRLLQPKLKPKIFLLNWVPDIDLVLDGSCGNILIVAIGGGGTTTIDAGSGSGYVEHAEISPPPSGQLRAEVGGAEEATELKDRSDDREGIQTKTFWT